MSTHPWRRYVAIGDSFSEGMNDADPQAPGRFVGWTDRLAAHLAERTGGDGDFRYANLAIRGRLLADITGPQLDAALALGPDLVSIVGGGNDYLRPTVDVDRLAASLDDAVGRIRATGADVLMVTPTDPAGAPVLKHVRGRAATYTALLWGIAARHDAHLLDLWNATWLQDWRMWGEDRIHLTTDGHTRVASAALVALGLSDDHDFSRPLPPADHRGLRERLHGDLRWARAYGAPWVGRRIRRTSSGAQISPKRPAWAPVTPSERLGDA